MPSAKAVNEIPKVVFSRTLKTADGWPETRIAGGDTAEEIAKLEAVCGCFPAVKLRLLKSTAFPSSGILELCYAPADK